MEKIRNVFNWYNRTDRDILSASVLGAAGLFAADVIERIEGRKGE